MPDAILEAVYQDALADPEHTRIDDSTIRERVAFVSRNIQNRAGVRVLLACALAAIHQPHIDIRKPYTEIGTPDSFSGRTYDERYVTPFIMRHQLPCNPTTAFLTPALRNRNVTLTPDVNLLGRPQALYQAVLDILADVAAGRLRAEALLHETLRQLILFSAEKHQRMASLLAALKANQRDTDLAAETIVTLLEQHLACKGSSRLPVLMVTAAYLAVQHQLGEAPLPLEAHQAADSQTHVLGDIQITLVDDTDHVVTCFEMKMKRLQVADVELVVQEKLAYTPYPIDHYVFITTEAIDQGVTDYARTLHEQIGIEVVVLDCIGFVRYFLHLFYRQRMAFIEAYQALVLHEPESAVSQPLKEVWLTLRHAAESDG